MKKNDIFTLANFYIFSLALTPIPTVVTSDYEDENEEINDPESVEDLESISRRTI